MNYSIKNIVIAGGLAVVAVIAVVLYTSNVRDKARQDQHRVQVLVAARDIVAGTTGKQVIDGHLLVAKDVIQTDEVPGALTTTAGLQNLVVAQTIYHAQQVPSAVFQPPLTTGTSLQIRATDRAMSLPVDQDSGLVGVLKDGDHVDVLMAFKGGGGGAGDTRTLLRNIVVLTAPGSGSSSTGGDGDGHVLLKVTDIQASKLLWAEQFEKLWLIERPQTQSQDSPPTLETEATVLFDGLTPSVVEKAITPPPSFLKALAVVNGTTTSGTGGS
jgi:Flp pilus assembly protein CpaB